MAKRDQSKPTPRRPSLTFAIATEDDAAEIVVLRNAAAEELTRVHGHGHGHWSGMAGEKGVLYDIKKSRVVIARHRGRFVGTLRLATKKPWAIDTAYFTAVPRPLYLLDMAVRPDMQRRGVGRRLLEEAARLARSWPSQALRLDAYDSDAGAGPFYAKCGFREVGRVTYRTVPLVYFEMLL